MSEFMTPADPEAARANWERWLAITGNQAIHAEAEESIPLTVMFGASQQLSEAIIQNPELAYSVLDPEWLAINLTAEEAMREGEKLIASAESHSYRLDRLRYLKQWLGLRIAARDVMGLAAQPVIWRELSILADTILTLAHRIVWEQICLEKDLQVANPVAVFAFGKLGGHEVNYSSDIDLVYVVADGELGVSEAIVARYCERLGRALSDSMGRGMLYRVDLRLRPYGTAGPIAVPFSAWEKYYRIYSEPWEQLALIRARQVCGPPVGDFEGMRREVIFGKPHGDWFVDNLIEMRQKVEDGVDDRDLKRGRGGIRDVEFMVQILQALTAGTDEINDERFTLDAIAKTKLDDEIKDSLTRSYTILRKIEHRIQLGEGLQAHEIPENKREIQRVAHLSGWGAPKWMRGGLDSARSEVRYYYDQTFGLTFSPKRVDIYDRLLSAIPDRQPYIQMMRDNPEGRQRMDHLREHAGHLARQVMQSPALLEPILTGEIEEELAPWTGHNPVLRRQVIMIRFALGLVAEPWREISQLADDILFRHFEGSRLVPVMLGSFAWHEMGPASDLDVLLLAPDDDQAAAEREAEERVKTWPKEPFALDLRLRPNSGRGLLAPTVSALAHYAAHEMEDWERLAMRRFRTQPEFAPYLKEAYQLKITPETARELRNMKGRVEMERAGGLDDVKLGRGGIDDLQWAMQLMAIERGIELPSSTPEALSTLGLEEHEETWRRLLTARYHGFCQSGSGDYVVKGRELPGRAEIRELLENVFHQALSK